MMSQIERFGKYILLEKLASGGMAEVYLAKSTGATGVHKFVAIKRILPQFSENQEFIEMFREEAKICVNLSNSNVVAIFDFGIEASQFFLVMEYVEGRNLRQVINEIKKQQLQFSIEQICYMIREAAGGLDHAHRCIDGSTGRPLNIIHRDISPQNIMINFDGEVKIIDFGIAKAESQLEATKTGTLKGKFGYMSPEQADGQPIDLRTDVFSLGIVLWEMLANDRLFTSNSEAAILRKIRECQIPSIRKINPSVPPELEKIVNKALAKDRSLRYQTSAALHKDLNRFLNMQYPDFNAQDFAVFVKNAFAQAYQESRRKLVEYARVQVDDKTMVIPANYTSPTPTANAGNPPPNQQRRDSTVIDHSVPSAENLDIDTSTNIKVDLKGIQKERSRVTSFPGTPGMTNPRMGVPPQTRTNVKREKTGLYARASRSGLVDSVLNFAVKAGTAVILVVGGWWCYENGYFDQLIRSGRKMAAKNPLAANDGRAPMEESTEFATKARYQVTISSDPPGAQIFFDGEDQRAFTPKVINIEGNKAVHVTLKKENYFPYEIDFTAVKDAQTLSTIMQPLGRAAFVDIEIASGGGVKPIVEINGRTIGDKPPVKKYPIPSGVPVQIRARNQYSGAMGETTLTLEPEQKKAIELILGKN